MKLPSINHSNQKLDFPKKTHSLIKQKYKIIQDKNNDSFVFKLDSFLNKMKEVKEIRIYLKENIEKNEIDDIFIKDIEKEYAEQFLLKMKIFPTKKMIKKILKLCPLQFCDFELHNEFIYINNNEKFVKSIHIFPVFDRKEKKFQTIENITMRNWQDEINKIDQKSNNLHTIAFNENNLFFDRLKYKKGISTIKSRNNRKSTLSIETSPKIRNFFGTEENFKYKKGLSHIKRNNFSINTNTGLLYNREKIDDIFIKNRENVLNVQLFSNK